MTAERELITFRPFSRQANPARYRSTYELVQDRDRDADNRRDRRWPALVMSDRRKLSHKDAAITKMKDRAKTAEGRVKSLENQIEGLFKAQGRR